MRPYYNLAFNGDGRKMTGFMTPYRAWMWKQQELWRNVHEAQFEHFRKLYKRQWLEAFRSNADEYIYKYNITKAHTLRQWEQEMEGQEAERVKQAQQSGARAALKAKHLDILREYHERHFFHWYERASERLQYFSRMQWVARDDIDSHIEKELNKYVRGKDEAYPLNFVGQMPMIEDEDGAVVEVPESTINLHQAQFSDTMPAAVYEPPKVLDAESVLRDQISGAEADLEMLTDEERLAMEDIVSMEEALSIRKVRVAKSEDATKEEAEIEKQKYLLKHSGGVGTKAFIKASRSGKDSVTFTPDDALDAPPTKGSAKGGKKAAAAAVSGIAPGTTPKKPSAADDKKKKAPKTLRGEDLDAKLGHIKADVKIGEVVTKVPKLEIEADRFEEGMRRTEEFESRGGKKGPGPRVGGAGGDVGGGGAAGPTHKKRRKDDDDDDGM